MKKTYQISFLYDGKPRELIFKSSTQDKALDAFYEEMDEHFAETGIDPDVLSEFVSVSELKG